VTIVRQTLRFVGVGEAFDPQAPNTSLLYEGRRRLLIDCGYSVPQALWQWLTEPEALDGVYLSHSHADHSFGLPALLLWMRFGGRRRPLQLFTGPGGQSWAEELLERAYPGAYQTPKCFPLQWTELSPSDSVVWDGLELAVAPSAHSIANHALRVTDGGLSFGYSGDGAPTAATRVLFQPVTWLVHECHSLGEHREGHACLSEVQALARESVAQRVALVHLAAPERAHGAALDDGQRLRVPAAGELWSFPSAATGPMSAEG
jgi:ribonuclease Z